jgi:glycosyltransferase involved in cell wall biosynthesis
MISVLIPTRNEEKDLPGCLESVCWSDDVHVDDSCSTDDTAAIAARAGAKLFLRSTANRPELFNGDEAAHKNWSIANLRFKYNWVLHVDADERVTPELAASIQSAVRNPGDRVAFRVGRRDFWDGRWLKHVQASAYYVRLFRPEKMRYERLVNPISIPDGPVGDLSGYLDHYPFSKGLNHWLDRHNWYSSLEAQQILLNRLTNQPFSVRQAFFAQDRNQRRFHQKELFYHMPARPLLKFLLLYGIKRGFLDGVPGFRYALLQSFYESMIVLKTKELAETRQVPVGLEQPASGALQNLHANPRTSD